MRLSLIALGLLAVACGPAVARTSGQLGGGDAFAPNAATPVATAEPTVATGVSAAPTAAPTLASSAPAATPLVTTAPATAAPTTVAGFDPLRYIGQGDRYNCGDFVSQAQAQAVLRADPRDPNRLDADVDGIACESNRAPFDRTPVVRR